MRLATLALASLLCALAYSAPAIAQQTSTIPCTAWSGNEIAVEANGTLAVKAYSRTGTLLHSSTVTPQAGCDWYADFGGDGSGVQLPWDVTTFEFTYTLASGTKVTTVYTYSQGYRTNQPVSFYYPSGSTATDHRIRFEADQQTGQVRALYPANNPSVYLDTYLGSAFVWPYDDERFCYNINAPTCSAVGPSVGPFLARIPAVPAPGAPPTYTFAYDSYPALRPGETWVWNEPGLVLKLHYLTRIAVYGTFSSTGTTFTSAVPTSGWLGIFFGDGSAGTLTNPTVTGLRGLGGQCCHPTSVAVQVEAQNGPAAEVIVSGATFQGNTGPTADAAGGVYAYGAYARLTVTGESVIQDFDGTGVLADAGAHVTLTGGSIVRRNGRNGGFAYFPGTLLTISGESVVETSGWTGVWAEYGATIRVEGNALIRSNALGGLVATGQGSRVNVGLARIWSNPGGPGVETRDGARSLFDRATLTSFADVTSNGGGLSALTGGNVDAGRCGFGGCPVRPHNIVGNAPGGFDARSMGGSVLFAEGDYWGPNRTLPKDLVLVADKSSLLDVDPLSTVPSSLDGGDAPGRPAPPSSPAGRAAPAPGSAPGEESSVEAPSPTAVAVDAAFRALADGDTTAAFEHVAGALAVAATADDRRLAFGSAAGFLFDGQPAALVAWLEGRAAAGGAGRPWALRAIAVAHAGGDEPVEAAAVAQALAAEYTGGEHALYGLALLVRLAVEAGDEAGALDALGTLAASFPDADETARAMAAVAITFPDADVGGALTGRPATSALAKVQGASEAFDVTVRPNPVSSSAVVTVSLNEEATVTATVYDALGRTVAVIADGPRPAGAHDLPLDGSALAPGVYVVHVAVWPAVGGPAHVAVRRVTVAR